MKPASSKRLIVHVTPSLHTALKVLAAQRGRSMSEMVQQWIQQELVKLR